MEKRKSYAIMVLSNLLIMCFLVVAYSPGLLNLRPSDPSIFRAGMSILAAPLSVMAVILVDRQLFGKREQRVITDKKDITLDDVMAAMHNYQLQNVGAIHYLGDVRDQILKMQDVMEKALDAVTDRFEPGSVTYSRYLSALQESSSQMMSSAIAIVKQLPFYDEGEYVRLKETYKDDNIPDDIQESKLAMMETMKRRIDEGIELNERLTLQMERLTMELVSREPEKETTDNLVEEIERLSKELKYYA